MQELGHVVLHLAGDRQGVGDVEVESPQAGVLAVFQLVGGISMRYVSSFWARKTAESAGFRAQNRETCAA